MNRGQMHQMLDAARSGGGSGGASSPVNISNIFVKSEAEAQQVIMAFQQRQQAKGRG